jgi:hypothetical protein
MKNLDSYVGNKKDFKIKYLQNGETSCQQTKQFVGGSIIISTTPVKKE